MDEEQTDRKSVWEPQRYKISGICRDKSLKKAQELCVDYYFVVDCDCFITPCTLQELISKNKPIVAPMLVNYPESAIVSSDFSFDILQNTNFYFHRHVDYLKVYQRILVGTFPVPELFGVYLIQAAYFSKLQHHDATKDYPYMVFSRSARKHGVDQYICNEKDFGVKIHFCLIDPSSRKGEGSI